VTPFILPIPFRDPLTAFAPLAKTPMAVLLDSARDDAVINIRGRYSYIAADPFRTIRCAAYPWSVSIDGVDVGGDPFTVLAEELAKFKTEALEIAPFGGGAIGFFSYELGGALERLPPPRTQPCSDDMIVGLYDVVAVFDLVAQKAWIVSTGFPQENNAEHAKARAAWLADTLGDAVLAQPQITRGTWQAETTRETYQGKVGEIIEAIRAGDIYQANFTQRFTATVANGASFDLYRRLKMLTPAPFGAFFNAGATKLMSASPERFLKLDAAGNVETRPIKGTRPRGETADEDTALAAELSESTKDRAENLMIVDLLRNDLARVCEPGSVRVPQLCALETFPAVHHLVSVVTGTLRSDMSAVDLLRAAFPGGSITGAPKIKAMEVIHALESSARGPYCGTIAWLGFDGAMDSSIVIRTLVQSGDTLTAQAGGGIVAQSDPAAEYNESMIKLQPLLAVLEP